LPVTASFFYERSSTHKHRKLDRRRPSGAACFSFAIIEAFQPQQRHGREEQQALKKQYRCELAGFGGTVDVDVLDRSGANG
jgi:hypothetical protein